MLAHRRGLFLALGFLSPAFSHAASFDITTEYRLRALTYTNLNLNPSASNGRSFLSQRARLGFALKDIQLGDGGGEAQSMEVGVRLHALGVAGSTSSLAAPFDRIADHYPNASFIPFVENAYLKIQRLAGWPWEFTFGRQSFQLGQGLLLDDDGAGLSGLSVRYAFPWRGIKSQLFLFQPRNRQLGGEANLDLYGLSLEFPGEGTWQWHNLAEIQRETRALGLTQCPGTCLASRSRKWFSSLRYQLNYGPMVFDGEAALEKGAATPTGPGALGNHVTYNGNAQVLKAKWRQPLWKDVPGIARVSILRGSGDDPGTPTTDEAFFPALGHRYDGLERSGVGEFFAASPYDAFGGQSTATASGLQRGASGILAVGLGVTPPAWKGIVLDIDYYLYQADRNIGYHRNLGRETDLRLRYDIQDRFSLKATAAFFRAGAAADPSKSSARRYMLEASGRF